MCRTVRTLVLCGLLAPMSLAAEPPSESAKSAHPQLTTRHRLLLSAAENLASTVREPVWPGWSAPLEVLLIADDHEILLGGSRLPDGFTAVGEDPELGPLAVRPRVFPASMLATMPVFGPPPTIVVGTPETTELGSSGWLQVLMHEHFHQWQMGAPEYYEEVAALDLAGGDTTGRWMLEYPFPYDDEEVAEALDGLSRRLARLLRRPADQDLSVEAMRLWKDLARLEQRLTPAEAKYLNFQLWQEGVARFIEVRVAEVAAAEWRPPAALQALSDFEDFGALACAAWENLFEELESPDLSARRRVSFYALGAGMALLLDRTEPGWKQRVAGSRFRMAPALSVD